MRRGGVILFYLFLNMSTYAQTDVSQHANYYIYTRVVADLPSRLEIRSCLPVVVINSSNPR